MNGTCINTNIDTHAQEHIFRHNIILTRAEAYEYLKCTRTQSTNG